MANYYNNGGFSNRKTNYVGGLIYNPSAFVESAGTISVRTMRNGDQVTPQPAGPGADEIPFSPAYPLGSTFYAFPAIDSLWDSDVDLGFVVTCSDTSVALISNPMTISALSPGTTVLLDYAPPAAQAAVSWSVHMFYGQPPSFGGFHNFHQSASPGTPGASNVMRTSFAIRGGCVGGQIRPDFYSFYNKNINYQPSPSSIPQTWPVSVGTRGVVLSFGWLDDDAVLMSQAAEMDAMLISNYAGPGSPGNSASLGVGYRIFNSPAGGTFFGNSLFGNLGGNSDQASSGSMFIPIPLIQTKTYNGTPQPKRSGIWDVGASYRAKFQGPKEKRTKVVREYPLSTPIVYANRIYDEYFSKCNISPDGKSIYGTSNLTTGTLNDVFKIPLANAWDFSSINVSDIARANILTAPSSGGLLSSLDNRYALTMSDDGKSITLYGVSAGSTRLFSVPLDVPYDVLSTNTQVILRSLIPGKNSYNVENIPSQILGKGGVIRFLSNGSVIDPESLIYYTYRGFSDFPYSANGFPSTSYVPASRNWRDFAYSSVSGIPGTAPNIDNLFFSDDGRYAVTNPDATLKALTIVKLNTPFDPLTAEIYDQIEFANTTGTFVPTSAMKIFPADYKVMYYDQENDKIFLYRRRFSSGIVNQIMSIVEIS